MTPSPPCDDWHGAATPRELMPLRCLKLKTGAAVLASACALVSVGGWAADIDAPPEWASKHSEAAIDPAIVAAVDASGRSIDVAALALRLRSARYVLLGEIHDDAVQHHLRAAVLRELLADGRPTWLVFEQIDREHNAALAAAGRDTEDVVSAGQLDKKGWRWPLHRPLFDAALAGGASVVGGNLSRAEASLVVRGGVAQAPADLQRWLTAPDPADGSPSAAWTATQDALLRQQVDAGHCGALPPAMIAPMALAQRARDAALAAAMRGAPPGVRVVLIAGNGHVRRDIGVPHYLAAAPDGIVSIAFLERGGDGRTVPDGPYDEAWFTAPLERPDPCATFHPPGVVR